MSDHFERILESYLNKDGTIKRRIDPSQRNTVEHDKWDRQLFNEVIMSIKALGGAQDNLDKITNTAPPAIMDLFWEFLKVDPEMRALEEITPSYVINFHVMQELLDLPDIEKIRFDSVLDTVSSAFGVVDMEPELEIIFDRLKKLQEQAQQMEDDLISLSDGSFLGQSDDGESKDGDQESDGQGKSNKKGNAQENQKLAKKAQELMKQAKGLDQELSDANFEIQQALKRGIDAASDNAALDQTMADAWGLEPGGLKHLDPKKRIGLSKKMRTPKFQKIAQMFGPMLRLAIAEQERKVRKVPHEVMDVEVGNDIPLVLPTEMLALFDEDLEMLWFKNYIEGQLLQYAMDGEESAGRGSIILCEDGSGSMSGNREIWAKAVSLALLYIAGKQKRDFYGIHFGSPGEHIDFDFNHKDSTATITHGNSVEISSRLDGTVRWAETFFGAGTDFCTPLSIAMARLLDEFNADGKVTGDIVFITDGECALTSDFIDEFVAVKQLCGFKVWSILIGFDTSCLSTFSDHILYLDDLNGGLSEKNATGLFSL